MTDVEHLDELAAAITRKSPAIRRYALAQAAATQSQEAEIRRIAEDVEVLRGAHPTLFRGGVPPGSPPAPPGPLKWKPPGWDLAGDPTFSSSFPGYTVVNAGGGPTTLTLDDLTDYYVNLGTISWSSHATADTNGLVIAGGRNVVIVGGEILFNSTNTQDDGRSIIIDDGNSAGIVHIEGVRIRACNGPTLRTKRVVQMQNCHIIASMFQDDDSGGVHPDIVQIWDRGRVAALRMHRCTSYSDYTGISCLLAPNPLTWEIYDCDIHASPPQANSVLGSLPLLMGHACYHNAGNTPYPDGPYTQWTATNLWLETGYSSPTNQRKLDDVLILRAQTGSPTYWPFEITPGPAQSGTKYISPDPPAGGTAPAPLGRRQGDFLTFERVAHHDDVWTFGIAPTSAGADANGNFCDSSAGAAYVSPGYL